MIEDILHPLLGAYTRSPQWFKSSVGRCYAAIPNQVRYGRSYKQFLNDASVQDNHIINEARTQKLLATIKCALHTVPFYRPYAKLLRESSDPLEILSALPLIAKEDIKAELSSFVSSAQPPSRRLETFTGGSTAAPMKFYLHKGVTRSKEFAYFQNFESRTGFHAGATRLAMRGRVIPGAGQPGKPLWMYEPIKNQLVLSSDHLERQYMPGYVAALSQWKPALIQAFPSALFPLARWLEEHPENEITSRIKGIQLTSENCYDDQLAKMRQVFDCPIFRHYGHSERVLFGATLFGDDRYFFWPLYGYLELVDHDGLPIQKPGVLGEIVGTSFDNSVMPFVRYRTGDLGMWAASPQESGFDGWQVLSRIEGRLQEFVVCADNRLISICSMGAAHFQDLADVEAIQYQQSRPGFITLRLQTRETLNTDALNRITNAVRDKTQGGCEVSVECVPLIERTQRGKLKLLDQRLDLSGFLGASAIE